MFLGLQKDSTAGAQPSRPMFPGNHGGPGENHAFFRKVTFYN